MKCTFALLVNKKIHNFIRKKALEMHLETGCGFYAAQLPPHISLKQPFEIDDLKKAEDYFDKLSKSIKPFSITFGPTFVWKNVFALDVVDNPELREYHNKINSELKELFENTSALHDGDSYAFHATIAIDRKDDSVFSEVYEKVKDETVSLEYVADKIVMFYYDEDNCEGGTFITYKINELLNNYPKE
jgi:2'-5' RNA ligase